MSTYYNQFLKDISAAQNSVELGEIVEHDYGLAVQRGLAWGEEAEQIEHEEPEKARMLRAAEERWFEIEGE